MSEVKTAEEILKFDFYDIVGVGSVGLSDKEKIEIWNNFTKNGNGEVFKNNEII